MQPAATTSLVDKTAGFAHPPRNVSEFGIRAGMSVADFGSGSGAYVLLMAQALQGSGHVYAVDIQRDLLRRTLAEAKERGLANVDVVWADVEKPGASKIAKEALDIVLISNLLFQVDDKRALLREARRILKPTGHLVLIDWADSYGGMGPQQKQVVTQEQALALASECGFALQREFPAGAHHWGAVCKQVPLQKTVV